MKKWKFFPILVKERIVAYMFVPDILSFAKCSKKCQNLLTFVPIQLPFAVVEESSQFAHRPNLNPNHQISPANFSILATSRKFYVEKLELIIKTEENKNDVKAFIENMKGSQKLLKVKELSMNIRSEHAELFTKTLVICDPSCIESIKIPKLLLQEVYDKIVKTPQWKNCKQVLLNYAFHLTLNLPNVNIDDFQHFKTVRLGVETLSIEDSVKLVQIFRNTTELIKYEIRCRKPMQQDLIRLKIEAGWAGNWQENQQTNTRFVIDPAKPDHVFEFNYSSFDLQGRRSLLDEFNERQLIIGRLFALH